MRLLAGILLGIVGAVVMSASAAVYYGYNPSTGLETIHGQLVDGSPVQSITSGNCTIANIKGGSTAGQFTVNTTATCNITLTEGSPAPNGYTCLVMDATAASFAQVLRQTSQTTTSCTLSGAINSGDIVIFIMIGY
jgi:hypothetical protein